MIGRHFSGKFRGLVCAVAVSLPLGVLALEPVKPQAAPSPLTVNPLKVEPVPTLVPPPAPIVPHPVVNAQPVTMTNLVFDAETKEFRATNGATTATFKFEFRNVSDVPVQINGVQASCGCTTAQLPPMPWIIQPHSNDVLNATMTLVGKPPGDVTKVLTINATNGIKQVFVKSIIPQPLTGTENDRQKNMELAKADRQAVFKNDCAKCHVDKSKGLMGAPLYAAACGICHDSPARASIVPDLHNLNHPTDAAFWKTLTADGKPNTLMPAFSTEHGGPLSNEQIDSLVAYLTTDFAKEKSVQPIKLPPTAPAQPPQSSAPPAPPGIPGKPQLISLPQDQPAK